MTRSSPSYRSFATLVGLLAISATAIAACSSTASTATSTSPSKSNTGTAIHVTVLSSFTGAYAQIGQAMYQGAAVGAAAVNAAGGVNGSKIVLDKVDTRGDPADAVPAFQQELATNHPAGVIGPTTLEIFGVQSIIDRNKIPDFFNGGSTAFDKSNDPWIWRINPSDSQLALALAYHAINAGVKKAAVLFTTEASQQELEPFLVKDFTRLGGTVTTTVNVTPGVSSYNSEIVKIVGTHPQAILGQLDPPTAATFFSELHNQVGTKLPFYGTDVTAGSDWIKAVTPAYAHAAVTSVQGGTPANPAGTAFTAGFKKLYNEAAVGGANYAYDGVLDLALAMDFSKGTTNTDITGGLPHVSNPPGAMCYTYASCVALLKAKKKINYEGASGPMDFDSHRNVSGPWDVVKSDPSGKLVTLTTVTPAQVTAAAAKING